MRFYPYENRGGRGGGSFSHTQGRGAPTVLGELEGLAILKGGGGGTKGFHHLKLGAQTVLLS